MIWNRFRMLQCVYSSFYCSGVNTFTKRSVTYTRFKREIAAYDRLLQINDFQLCNHCGELVLTHKYVHEVKTVINRDGTF